MIIPHNCHHALPGPLSPLDPQNILFLPQDLSVPFWEVGFVVVLNWRVRRSKGREPAKEVETQKSHRCRFSLFSPAKDFPQRSLCSSFWGEGHLGWTYGRGDSFIVPPLLDKSYFSHACAIVSVPAGIPASRSSHSLRFIFLNLSSLLKNVQSLFSSNKIKYSGWLISPTTYHLLFLRAQRFLLALQIRHHRHPLHALFLIFVFAQFVTSSWNSLLFVPNRIRRSLSSSHGSGDRSTSVFLQSFKSNLFLTSGPLYLLFCLSGTFFTCPAPSQSSWFSS